jgi:hypothetical protein
MKKGLNFIIPLHIYPFDIMFSVGQTDKDFTKSLKLALPKSLYKEMKDNTIFHLEPGCRGRTAIHLSGGQTIIRLPSKPSTPQEFGTVSHEIFHGVDFIFNKIGIPLSEYSDEAYAYLIGYVTEKFYEEVSI